MTSWPIAACPARRGLIQESRRRKTAQVHRKRPVARLRDDRRDAVVRVRIVRKTVKQDDREAAGVARVVVGDLEHVRANGLDRGSRGKLGCASPAEAGRHGRPERTHRQGRRALNEAAAVHDRGLSYGTILDHSLASDRATTATTGCVSLTLNTSCGTPGSMKMKSPAPFSTTCVKPSPYS